MNVSVSELLLDGRVRFEVRPGVGYLPFQGCVQKWMPGAGPETLPFAFSCPLFAFGGGPDDITRNSPRVVWDLLPPDVRPHCNNRVAIFFICDVIDALATVHGWDEKRVGEWLRTVEDAMRAAHVYPRGCPR